MKQFFQIQAALISLFLDDSNSDSDSGDSDSEASSESAESSSYSSNAFDESFISSDSSQERQNTRIPKRKQNQGETANPEDFSDIPE